MSSFWSAVQESLRGSQQDYTAGSLPRAILLLAIPMILEMAMESLFGIVDVFFVSGLGTDAVAAVALTESVLTVVFGVAMGLSMAATAMVARRIGEKDSAGAGAAAAQAIWIGLGVSAVTGVAGALYAPDLLRLMGGTEIVVRMGTGYARYMLGGTATIFLLFLNNAIFRGAGDAALAMRALWLANLVNIVLDPCLILGLGPFPKLGLDGAAVATNIGRGLGVAYQFAVQAAGGARVSLGRGNFAPDWPVLGRLLRVSFTGIVQFLVATASWMALVRLIARFGSPALAGYMIAIRVVIFSILPSWGLSNAAATLVGQNLGAGAPERAERSVWLAGFYNMLFLGAIAVAFLMLARPIIGVFTSDPAAAATGADCLRIIGSCYVFYAWGMVMVQAFNGAGDTVTPMIVNLFCYWAFQIPLGWALAVPAGFGPDGVFWAVAAAESLLAAAGVVLFRRGRWKRQAI